MFQRPRFVEFTGFRSATESLDRRVIDIGYGSGLIDPLQVRWLR